MNLETNNCLSLFQKIYINSETAVEVVEVYCQYLFYTSILDSLSLLGFIAIIALFGWYLIKVIKEVG